MMVKYGRTDCLSHQLCETLMRRKWNNYGLPIFVLIFLTYLFLVTFLSIIVATHPICRNYQENHLNKTEILDCNPNQSQNKYYVNIFFYLINIFYNLSPEGFFYVE